MGQRSDEIEQPERRIGREEVYVARPGETQVVRAEGTRTVSSGEGSARAADVGDAGDATEVETEEIRAEIEHTRAEMSQTIDAIQERLTPQEIGGQAKDAAADLAKQIGEHVREAIRDATQQAKESVREATIGRAENVVSSANETVRGVGFDMLETIRRNPVPAALAGIGLGWLFMNRSSGSSEEWTYRGRTSYGTYPRGRSAYTYPERGRGYYDADLRGRSAYTYPERTTVYREEDEGRGRGVTDKVGDVAGQAQERASELASRTGEMASDVGERAMDVGSGLWETIRQNPIPAALAGISLGWLAMNASGRSSEGRGYYGYSPYPGGRYGEGYGGYYGERGYGRASYAYGYPERGAAYEGEERSGVGGVASKVGDTASQAQERAGELVGEAQERAGELVDQAQYRVQRAQGQLERMVQDNPLALGAVALALGTAVGLAVPETRREQELMGEARDRLVDKAQGIARETGEKVQRVAGEVQHTVEREARSEGLSG